jgi:superfamily II DNA or RNA helicase
MVLMDFQAKAVEEVPARFREHRAVLLTLPTGAGKTVVFAHLVKELAGRGLRSLVLVNRHLLLQQAALTFRRIGVIPGSFTAGGITYGDGHQCAIGMVKTVRNRLARPDLAAYFARYDVVVIDECHLGEFPWVFSHPVFEKAKILGVTATPLAPKGKKPLRAFYTSIIEPTSVPELIKLGRLVPCRHLGGQRDLTGLVIERGEYTDESQGSVLGTDEAIAKIVADYKREYMGQPFLIFNPSQDVSHRAALAFSRAGVPCQAVLSGNDDLKGHDEAQRSVAFAAFRSGKLLGLSNTAILTAGADFPDCRLIINNFKTVSRAKYYQILGRGGRASEGKAYFTCLDYGDNYKDFGVFDLMWARSPSANRLIANWSELFYNPFAPPSGMPAPVKDCPKCAAVLPAQSRVCPVCQYQFPPPRKDEAGPLADLGEVEVEKSLAEMLAAWRRQADKFAKSPEHAEAYVAKRVRQNLGLAGLREYAVLAGKPDGWADKELARLRKQLWADVKGLVGITDGLVVAAEIRKQLEAGLDFFKVEAAVRKSLKNPEKYLEFLTGEAARV